MNSRLDPHQLYVVDQLVGEVSLLIPEHVMPFRRSFFREVVRINSHRETPLIAPPVIAKWPVDLHRLYIAVSRRGGFKQATKDKSWKSLCSEANPQLNESSTGGYHLRLSYEKYLLELECIETGQEYKDLIDFVESLRKRKKYPLDHGTTKKKKGILGEEVCTTDPDTISLFDEDEEINVVDIDTPEPASLVNIVNDIDTPEPKERVKGSNRDSTRLRRIAEIAASPEEERELDEMSKQFMEARAELAYSQKQAAASIRGALDTDMSQTTISRFENCKLSVRNMKNVKILLDDWIEKVKEALKEGKTAAEFLKESMQKAQD